MQNDEDYSDIEQSIDENPEYQIDNDEIDGAEEGFLKGYHAADDDYGKSSEEEFDSDDEIEK